MTKATVLIFGEGAEDNDRRAMEHLIHALAPEGVTIRCRKQRSPIILDRGAQLRKRKKIAVQVAAIERNLRHASKGGERVVTVAFHDCDDVEPAHVAESARLEGELRAEGVSRPVAATPAWCVEAWWMLFPEALKATRGCWAALRSPANVGDVRSAKEQLVAKLRPAGHHRCPEYHENDSVEIARQVREQGLADDHRTNRSGSLRQFRDTLRRALTGHD